MSPASALLRGSPGAGGPILAPGRNAWRRAHAARASFLIDAADYFTALDAALQAARSTIFVVGWDIDSRLELVRDPSPDRELPTRLAALLSALARRNDRLEIYVLAWDFAPIYLFEREPLPRLRLGLRTHERVHFHLDDQHPPGGSQHQKLVVIDDALAFCGGLDLCDVRWDTSEHRAADPRRVDVHGRPYHPHHDVQMAVDGQAAASLGELVRARWASSTGWEAAPSEADDDPWPSALRPDVTDVNIGVARTIPASEGEPGRHEVRALWCDAIAAARRSIYIETPFLTSEAIEAALAARLAEPDGPEVVIVRPHDANGWLEDMTMKVLADGVVRRLRAVDGSDRLRVLCPFVAGSGGEGDRVAVHVHAKVCIVDDRFLKIGSSNVTDRSLGLDRECDLALEAEGPRASKAIADLRDRLLGEHLGVHPERVRAEHERRGSLRATIAALGGGDRTLRPYEPGSVHLAERWLRAREVIDPRDPLSLRQLGRLLLSEGEPRRPWAWAGVAWWVLVIVGIVAADLSGAIDFEALTAWMVDAVGSPARGCLVVAVAFVVSGMALIPVTLMIADCGVLFGPGLGLLYALLGAFVSAAVYYWLGRWMGRDLVHRFAGPRLHGAARAIARRGILAVAAIRLVPLAPHVVVGLVAGAARITFRDYMLGTIVAMAPGGAILVLAGAQVSAGRPWWMALGMIALLAAVGLVLAWALQRWVGRREEPPGERGDSDLSRA